MSTERKREREKESKWETKKTHNMYIYKLEQVGL